MASLTAQEASFLAAVGKQARKRKGGSRIEQWLKTKKSRYPESTPKRSIPSKALLKASPCRGDIDASRVENHVDRSPFPQKELHYDEEDSSTDGLSLFREADEQEESEEDEGEEEEDEIPKPVHRQAAAATNGAQFNAVSPSQKPPTARPPPTEPLDRWTQMFGLLRTFQNDFGTTDCRPGVFYRNAPLGRWVLKQRQAYHEGTISAEHQKRLEDIGFSWREPTIQDEKLGWSQMLDLLLAYHKEYGVWPEPSTIYRSVRLGRWAHAQKNLKAIGALDRDKAKRLEMVGFFEKSDDDKWYHMFQTLQMHKQATGTIFCPEDTIFGGVELGKWIGGQLALARDNALSPERKKLLADIGFANIFRKMDMLKHHEPPPQQHLQQQTGTIQPRASPDQEWKKYYYTLASYCRDVGTTFCPSGTIYRGLALGDWIARQIDAFREEKLDNRYQKLLEDIGYRDTFLKITMEKAERAREQAEAERLKRRQEELMKDPWNQMFVVSLQYRNSTGACYCPAGTVFNGVPLGDWLSEQMEKVRDGTLEPSKRSKLESMGFVAAYHCLPGQKMSDSQLEAFNQWLHNYGLLRNYKKDFRTVYVPHDEVYGDVELGRWMIEQVALYKAGELHPEKLRKLESLGFTKAYEKEIKAGESKKEDSRRQSYSSDEDERKPSGSPEKEVPPPASKWSPDNKHLPPSQQRWNKMFELLKAYKREHGNCQVPFSYTAEDGSTLGSWVRNQRVRLTNGSLRSDLKKKLDTIDFLWRVQTGPRKKPKSRQVEALDKRWNQLFDLLVEYKKEKGHCQILTAGNYKGQPLGEWVRTQRKKYKEGSLRSDRQERLESIDFVWKVLQTTPPPSTEQRGAYSDDDEEEEVDVIDVDAESDERHSKAKAGGGGQRDGLWNSMFNELLRYKEENGDCMVRAKGSPLGEWVRTQRKKYKEGSLRRDRLDRLGRIGFVWRATNTGAPDVETFDNNPPYAYTTARQQIQQRKPDPPTADEVERRVRPKASARQISRDENDTWLLFYERLSLWAEKQRYSPITVATISEVDHKLGRWLKMQRQKRAKNLMPPHQKEKLDEIGFIWDEASPFACRIRKPYAK